MTANPPMTTRYHLTPQYTHGNPYGHVWARASKRAIHAIGLILLLSVPAWAQTYTLAPQAKFTAFDSNGDPIASGKLCTYAAGTVTPATTYQTSSGTANTNPVIMDSAGRANVWLTPGQSYKFTLLTAGTTTDCTTGSTVWTVDNIGAVPASAANLDVLGTAGTAISAGQVVYLSDGSGSLSAGQWYLADQDLDYASSRTITGIAPNAISAGVAGTIRLGGQATGLSALSVGSEYFVSATAGGLTATAPQNRRLVGKADTTSSLVLVTAQPTAGLPIDSAIDEFRLSLTTAVPVTTADVTGASAGTLFLEPYKGNRIALYDAAGNATVYTSGEMSLSVPALTSQMYDVFVFAGTSSNPTLEVLAWTNDTTRATAIVSTVAVGVLTKSGDATRRYVGSFRTTTVANQTEDSFAKRFLWNYYNQIPRPMRVNEAADTWAYNTTTWRQANASTANQLAFVVGVAGAQLTVEVNALARNDTAGQRIPVGIGKNSTTTPLAGSCQVHNYVPVANYVTTSRACVTDYPAVGFNFYAWLEIGAAAGNTTFVGDNADATLSQSGISGILQ